MDGRTGTAGRVLLRIVAVLGRRGLCGFVCSTGEAGHREGDDIGGFVNVPRAVSSSILLSASPKAKVPIDKLDKIEFVRGRAAPSMKARPTSPGSSNFGDLPRSISCVADPSCSSSLSISAGDIMCCGTYSDAELRFGVEQEVISSHVDDARLSVDNDNCPPMPPNEDIKCRGRACVTTSRGTPSTPSKLKLLKSERRSSSTVGVGLEDLFGKLIRFELEPENNRLRG